MPTAAPKLTTLEKALLVEFARSDTAGILAVPSLGVLDLVIGLEVRGLVREASVPEGLGFLAGHSRAVDVRRAAAADGVALSRYVITRQGTALAARLVLLEK